LLGLSLDHGRGHIIRALMEGISMELRWMLDAILEMGTPVNDVYLAGGGARNAHWNQIHATILGRPVKTLRLGEAAMVGAAMCAAVALGEYEEWRSAAAAFVNVGDEIEPDVSQQAVYERLYDTYKAFFRLLSESGLFNRLTEISSED
jgi:xylulokinase